MEKEDRGLHFHISALPSLTYLASLLTEIPCDMPAVWCVPVWTHKVVSEDSTLRISMEPCFCVNPDTPSVSLFLSCAARPLRCSGTSGMKEDGRDNSRSRQVADQGYQHSGICRAEVEATDHSEYSNKPVVVQ